MTVGARCRTMPPDRRPDSGRRSPLPLHCCWPSLRWPARPTAAPGCGLWASPRRHRWPPGRHWCRWARSPSCWPSGGGRRGALRRRRRRRRCARRRRDGQLPVGRTAPRSLIVSTPRLLRRSAQVPPHADVRSDDRVQPPVTDGQEPLPLVELLSRRAGVAPQQRSSAAHDMRNGRPEHARAEARAAPLGQCRHAAQPPRPNAHRDGRGRRVGSDVARADDRTVLDDGEPGDGLIVIAGQLQGAPGSQDAPTEVGSRGSGAPDDLDHAPGLNTISTTIATQHSMATPAPAARRPVAAVPPLSSAARAAR